MLARNQDRAQTIAAQNNLPCIYFVDGGGAKLDAKAGLHLLMLTPFAFRAGFLA